MSQNASLRSSKGLAKGPSTNKTQQLNAETSTAASLKSKINKQHNSNETHNNNTTKHNLEQKETGHSSIKPTADQIRIAHLIGNNKSDDPEINKKIKQVQDVVPSKLPDEILMALHENDYDIARTIDYILEGGGDLSQDWKTAGIKSKKTTSPNQTLDEQADDLVQVTQQNSTRNNNKQQQNKNNESNNNNMRSRERNRERNPVNKQQPTKYNNNNKNNKKNDVNGASVPQSLERDETNLDDKFNTMDLNKENGSDFNSNEYYRNNKRGNMNYNNGPSRGTNGTNSYRGGRNGNAVTGRGGNRNTNNFRPNLNRNQRKDDMEIVENIPLQDDKVELILSDPITEFDPNVEVVKLNEQTELSDPLQTGRPTKDDNLRDIGTWSNEQADKNSSNRSSSSHKPAHFNQQQQPPASNRRFNPKTGAVNMKQNEDWENEEEWQGDLTQTQIFTASTQKKENENDYPQRANSEQQRQFDADFPIGHFNAEEAAQKIKNAVGIGSAIASTGSMNKKTPSQTTANVNNLSDESKDTKAKQQQQSQNFKVANKFGSVKPPPPSTRIPKSAVVMPDGSSNNGFSLDVQFGVDLDTPLADIKEPEPVQQPAAKIVTEPIGKKLNMVSPHMQQQIQKPIQQTVNKPVAVTNTTSVVSSVSSLGTFNSNNNEKIANVGVVNPVINSSNVQANSGVKLLNSDNSMIGVSNANKLDQNLAMTTSSVPLQQPLLTHNMDNMKKLNQDTFVDKQKQTNHQQNYQFQQQMNHLNIQKQQMPQKQHPYQNDSNNLNQNMIQQQRENNHHHSNNTNLNSHHYQQQHHHHHQQSNSNLNMTNPAMKDSTSSHNLSQTASSGNNSQLLNISPQNIANKNTNQSNQLNQQQQQQLMNHQNNTPNPLNQGLNSNSMNNVANAGVAAAAVNAKQTMPPPPGVNLVNPNSQFLMSLPFVCYDQQNFPYFDASQLDGNSIMQMYNHLGLNVPPGVNSAAPTPVSAGGATPGGPPYSTDSKFGRSEATSSNSQLNAAAAAAVAQLSQQQQQQQQPINLIPGLSNGFPFFFPNYYPNMFMSVPNGPQANPQYQNKQPYNFNNNAAYDDQNKEYTNYNPQAQIKPTGSNLNIVPDLNNVGYQKNIDKSNTGYHTPPPNYSNSLMNQQQHPNVSGSSDAPPQPAQYAYVTSMIGTPGGNPLVHTGLQQDNMNTRSIGNTVANSIKPLQKNNYQNSPWN